MLKVHIEGLKEIQDAFTELGKTPKKYISPAVKTGMLIAKKEAKRLAPKDTGELRRGIILVGEKTKTKGKKIYRIVFDRKKNHIFQKFNAAGKQTAYYPASQEYGWKLSNGKKVPEKRFVRNAITNKWPQVQNTIIGKLRGKMRDVLAKRGLK